MNPAFYACIFSPLERILQGDVELHSIFVQMHAALIICAVQKGDMHVVTENNKNYVRITDQGKESLLRKESAL